MTDYTTPRKHGHSFKDRTGQRFGRLLVTEEAECPPHLSRKSIHWKCLCDCGNVVIVNVSDLQCGNTTSCGCWRNEHAVKAANKATTKHGKTHTTEYNSWQGMKNRCYNVGSKDYPHWGGRGITVCERWLHSFENFYADMGPRPTKNHSLDRINNDGPYSPENCRWTGYSIQNKNQRKAKSKRNSLRVTYNGKTKTVNEWSREMNIPRRALHHRIARGWSIEDALFTPLRKQ